MVDEEERLLRLVREAPAEVRQAALLLLTHASAPREADAAPGCTRPAMTDREVAAATLRAVGELAVRLTGEPLEFRATVACGYVALKVP